MILLVVPLGRICSATVDLGSGQAEQYEAGLVWLKNSLGPSRLDAPGLPLCGEGAYLLAEFVNGGEGGPGVVHVGVGTA